jgi:hypothetical protein
MKRLIIAALLTGIGTIGIVQAAALKDADCEAVWKEAGGRTLSAEAAKPYVAHFEQVDIDKDGSIDYREFKAGCKAGLVQKASPK